MSWLKARFTEPSTWAGLAALIPTVYTVACTGLNSAAVGTLAAGVAAVLLKEKTQ
jgi:hypothetical protein